MFESQKEAVDRLLETDKEFRYFYEQHEMLDRQVDQAVAGDLPMDDATLSAMKKEKLMTKDKLASILNKATRLNETTRH